METQTQPSEEKQVESEAPIESGDLHVNVAAKPIELKKAFTEEARQALEEAKDALDEVLPTQ